MSFTANYSQRLVTYHVTFFWVKMYASAVLSRSTWQFCVAARIYVGFSHRISERARNNDNGIQPILCWKKMPEKSVSTMPH